MCKTRHNASSSLLVTLLLLCCVSFICGGYLITTPRKWTSGEETQICVTLSAPSAGNDFFSVEAKVETFPVDSDPKIILPKKEITVPAGEKSFCADVLIPPTTLTNGDLTIIGSLEGKTLNYTKPISIEIDTEETYIQTDKTLYKPNQNVQFRILSVKGPLLQVIRDSYSEIWIQNPSGNRLDQWLNVPNEDGLIHLSFRLSDEPEEGTYVIKVKPSWNSDIYKGTFKVEEYVLPRYEVEIKPPKYILGNSENFSFEVCAKYTFGQPVNGNLTLKVDNNAWGSYKITVTMMDKISGCTTLPVNASDLSINGDGYYAYSVNAKAVVIEDGTGVEISAKDVSIDIARTALDFEDVSVQKYYKPELPFVGEIKITLPDDSPAVSESMEVCCVQICKNLTTNANGILKFAIPPHLEGDISIKSNKYKHEAKDGSLSWRSIMYASSFRKRIKRYHSPSNSSLIIALTNDELECSSTKDTIDFDMPVRFTAIRQDKADVTVQILSRGQIQFSKMFEQEFTPNDFLYLDDSILLEGLKEPVTKDLIRGFFNVPVTLPRTVSPKAKVIVWYARDDGEVVSDARNVDITDCLLNSVDVSWSIPEAQPGDSATLSLKAEPLSLCSLGVVDKSVKLLSSKKNPLTVSALLALAEKSSVDAYTNTQVNDYTYCKTKKNESEAEIESPDPVSTRRRRRTHHRRSLHISRWPMHSVDVDSLFMFDEAGIYALSDLTLETRPCSVQYDYMMYVPANIAFSMAEDMDAPYGLTIEATNVGESGENKRTYFPETWIWDIVPIWDTGVTNEEVTLPDTITEWVGNAVCVHPTKGVGISPFASVVTFKDFFVDLTLPATVKRGEIFPVKISVFNYLDESLPLKLVLSESTEYDILADETDDLGSGERISCLPQQDKVVHSIRIKPTVVGDVNLTVTASVDLNSINTCGQPTGKIRTDIIIKPLLVEFEGFEKEEAHSKYVCTEDLTNGEDALETFAMEPPADIIPDSARGFIAVVADLMGPTLDNLGGLVKMPYGCGEQNMLNFAPNIFVMQYLDSSNQNNAETAAKAIEFMEKGYQRELKYRHSDGSYSAFGERDDSGSTWLTAFVLKSFAQARAYISLDKSDFLMSVDWLKSKQLENGCFESVGKVLHKGMKGGLSGHSSESLLSAFVLIALMESGESKASKTVRESLFCLKADKENSNPYSLAVRSYALVLAGSPDAEATINALMNLATDTTQTLSWELPKTFESSKGVGVETASYAVLALLTHSANNNTDYKHQIYKIIKWINNQRNGQGGFISTQDTIVALQALAAYEKTSWQGPVDLTVIATSENMEEQFTVNEKNKLLQQRANVQAFPTSVTFDIVGDGCVLIQSVLRYNVPEPDASEAFTLRVEAETEPDKGCKTKRIRGCVSYKLQDLKSNMGILEFYLVSGYIPDKSDLKSVVGYGTGLFKRYEVDGNKVTIYVDEFSSEEICVSFRIIREVEVENPKPGSVKVYDYYKPEYFVSEKYVLPPTTECIDKYKVPLPFEEEIVIDVVYDTDYASPPESTPDPAGDI